MKDIRSCTYYNFYLQKYALAKRHCQEDKKMSSRPGEDSVQGGMTRNNMEGLRALDVCCDLL